MRKIVVALLLLVVCAATETIAQTTEGSIRGFIRDEQGGLLPGVTVTATSAQIPTPQVAVTDQQGSYRLLNLAPGTYTLSAELQGFQKLARPGLSCTPV